MFKAVLSSETDTAGWRKNARRLIHQGVQPEEVVWNVEGRQGSDGLDLFAARPVPSGNGKKPLPEIRISKALLSLINSALLHRNEDRFDLAYRVLFRAQSVKNIHLNPVDADVKKLNQYVKSIRRDIHKMHAFVRFRKVGEQNSREQFVAWFEPDHHIVEAVAPFFRNRFAGMDWLIVTPEASIAWDGKTLTTGPGGKKEDVTQEDDVETEWRTYYKSIFNPARVKVQAMKSEMPMKYWKNLPEAVLIPELIEQSTGRVDDMIEREALALPLRRASSAERETKASSLDELYEMLENQTSLPQENFSNKIVRGEGPSNADIMFVGEQPGDIEDQVGRPFVGPAGQMLDRALAQAGIDRQRVFLTNAVKRFKYIQRGKRRIHQTPSAGDVSYYRWWVEQERRLVAPKLTIALGATAARSLVGKAVKISQFRGEPMKDGDNRSILITVHPSFLLRIPDAQGRDVEYQKFVRELASAKSLFKVTS